MIIIIKSSRQADCDRASLQHSFPITALDYDIQLRLE